MTPKAVYDTNIIISAALSPSGIPSSLLVFAFDGVIQLYVSPVILDEYTEVLSRPKFDLSPQVITGLMRKITHVTHAALLVHPTRTISASPDESDNRFLECAHEAGASYLVTGNKRHFPFPEFEGIKILSPAEFTRIVLE
jgi:putative PIN family toxin of toxin-antitoxin system